MNVRKIREDEYERTREVFSIAFETKLEEVKRAPAGREERFWRERWAAFDDSGVMMGFLIGSPATIRFDGAEAGCTCIGGVSSLPQYRGKRVIAGCFRQHLEDSYRDGHVFSYLYPFSTAFYRQFGYELCAETVEWTFETAVIPPFSGLKGEAVLNEGDSQLGAARQVYGEYLADYNLSFVREDCDWNRVISKSPAVESKYTYVWRNSSGIPKGVLCFRKEYDSHADLSTMLCDAFYYADEEGLMGLLKHIRSYRSHMQRVKLTLSKDAALERLLPEVAGRCRRELRFTGMGRVIHAEQALRLAKYRGSGRVALKLTDPCIEANNRVYRVTFEQGQCTRIDSGEHYDTELEIGTFSRLLLGNCSAEEIPCDTLKKIFYPKKMFICDFF